MANLNKLRQVNPHWKPSKSFIEDQEAAKQKVEADKYDGNIDPVQKVLAQQIEELEHKDAKIQENKSSPCANNDSERPKEFSEIYKEIANKVIDDIEDQLFELINEYSEDYDELYWNRYLTDDAPVELLDAAFENYHEHYDNIFKIIMKHFITN